VKLCTAILNAVHDDRERDFVSDIRTRIANGESLTLRQSAKLQQIYNARSLNDDDSGMRTRHESPTTAPDWLGNTGE
jgi:hypothetical protein